jgi:hypothetical protein
MRHLQEFEPFFRSLRVTAEFHTPASPRHILCFGTACRLSSRRFRRSILLRSSPQSRRAKFGLKPEDRTRISRCALPAGRVPRMARCGRLSASWNQPQAAHAPRFSCENNRERACRFSSEELLHVGRIVISVGWGEQPGTTDAQRNCWNTSRKPAHSIEHWG